MNVIQYKHRRFRPVAESLEARITPATLSTFLTTPHTDLYLGFASGAWSLQARNTDTSTFTAADDTVLYVGTNAADSRPAGSEWDFLGVSSGQSVYVLPQTQDPNRLFLGFSGAGIGSGTLDTYDPSTESGGRVTGQGRWAKATVVNVNGPGDFSIWQTPETTPIVYAATSDGLDSSDAVWILSGGHTHFNWGFTEPGRYEVTFRLSAYQDNANPATPGTPTVTKDVTVYFSVANVGAFSFDPAAITVNEGAGTATVTVNRTGGSDGRVTVQYATSNGTAMSGSDYTATSGTLTFNDQETQKTFSVPIIDDAVIGEPDETINLTLSAPGPSSIAGFGVGLPGGSLLGMPTTHSITIVDNDDANLPTITAIADKSTPEETPIGVPFTIGDDDGIPGLTVAVTSSNTTLVPNTAAALAVSPANGSSVASRTLTITPAANQFGTTTITVTVTDAGGAQTLESFLLTVTSVANPPTANDEDYGVTPGNVLRGNVLLNDDAGPSGGPLTASLVTTTTKGTLLLNANGTFTYTPGAGFTGTDSFTYRTTGPDGSDVATATITGRPTEPTFEAVLSEGHTDVGIAYEDDAFDPHVHDEVTDTEYEASAALLHARPTTATPRPAGTNFDFIGVAAGQQIWVLPQAQVVGKLFLGVGAEEIPPSDFAGDLTLQILSVDGPGLVSLWQTDGFGNVIPLSSTSDGITTGDAIVFPPGGHFHENWGFTARGLYAVTLQFSGTPTRGANAGQLTFSEPATYYFAVDPQNATPVVVGPPNASIPNNGTLSFNGTSSISASDAENSSGDYSAVVTATNGTVTLPGQSAGAMVEVTGTLAEVNAALAGLVFTPTVGFVGAGSIKVDVTDPGFLVGAENAKTGSLTIPVDITAFSDDTTAPTVNISAPSVSSTTNGPVTFTITYADANFAASTLSLADITLNKTGTANGTVSVDAGSGTTRTVTISNITGDGTLSISLAAGTAHDVSGNQAPAAGPSQTVQIGQPQQPSLLAVGNKGGTVRIFDASTGTQITSVRPLDNGAIQYLGLVQVALADFTGDGVPDLAVSAADPLGTNGLTAAKAGKVFLYDGDALANGGLSLIHTFTPFATHSGPDGNTGAYTNGLNIAAGDINGDGKIDLVAGTRGQVGGPNGTVIGQKEFGRLVVLDRGAAADGSQDKLIGSIVTPFGTGYQKGVVVAAGNLDGVGSDEIAVTRGGPVAKSLPAAQQSIKLKAIKFSGDSLTELALSGNLGNPMAPFGSLDIRRDGRVALVDTDGDGTDELVFSALDRTTSNTQVRIAAFSVDTTSGVATAVSTGNGPSNSFVVGTVVKDHAIATIAPTGGSIESLALVTESTTSQIQFLDPLNGTTTTTGFAIALTTGGVTLNGF
ncbi:MAG: choice-of-anchor M domain-containing protein [Gemmataceae bacterium]